MKDAGMMRIKTGGWIWLEKLNKNWHLKKSENLRNGVFSVSLFFYSGDESWIERNNADSCKNEKEYGVDKIFTRYLIWASRVNSNLVIGVLPGEWVNIFVAYLLDFFLTVRSSFVDVCIINIHRTYGHIQFSIIDKYRVRWLSLLEQRSSLKYYRHMEAILIPYRNTLKNKEKGNVGTDRKQGSQK